MGFLKKKNENVITFPKPGQQPQPTTPGITVPGLDVSRYQGPVNWKKAWDLGYRFVFVKATDGKTGVDPMYVKHRDQAKAAGFIVGAYHYFRFDESVATQIEMFLKTTGGWPEGELPPVVDVEWDKFSSKYGPGKTMDTEAADLVMAYITLLGLTIRSYPIVYTNAYFFSPGRRAETFKLCKLWVPNYSAKSIEQVKIPIPWEKATFWQNSESFSLDGVDKIDTNIFLGSIEELRALTNKA